jgi:hypothetical protein
VPATVAVMLRAAAIERHGLRRVGYTGCARLRRYRMASWCLAMHAP